MRRREVLGAIGATLAWPLAVRAQNIGKTFRIVTFPDFVPQVADWFSAEMRNYGWTEGRDLIIEQSGTKPSELQLVEAAQRLVVGKPDLIVTMTTAHTLALQRVTSSIPIVMLSSGYPVEAGIANSLSRPGRNATGNALYAATGVWSKMLQLLHDARPTIKRVGVLWTYVVPAFPKEEIEPCYAELERGARSLGMNIHIVEVSSTNPLPAALAEIASGKPDGLVLTSLFTPDELAVVTRFAADNNLPTIIDVDWAPYGVSPLPLLSYGPVFQGLVLRAAATANKILRGAKAGDIPIQNPDRFEMVVNLKTAQAIGLSLPEGFLLRADKVAD